LIAKLNNDMVEMQKPLITIGVLCYNAEATVGRALDCALSQEWSNKEIIVVDDASTDNSLSILEEYKEKYPQILVIKHDTNQGTSIARNTVFSNFKGDYLAFFDDDDVSAPDRIKEQFKRLNEFKDPFAFCYCNRKTITADGIEKDKVTKGIGWKSPEPFGEAVAKHWLLNLSEPQFSWGAAGFGCFMAHRDAIRKVGFCDEKMLRAQDIEYAVQASFLGCHFVSVDRPLLHQYVTDTADKNYSRGLQSHLHMAKKYKDFSKRYCMYWYSLIMAHAQAHEVCKNKWRFKLLRSLAKRVYTISAFFRAVRRADSLAPDSNNFK